MKRAISLLTFTLIWEGTFTFFIVMCIKSGELPGLLFIIILWLVGLLLVKFTFNEFRRIYEIKRYGITYDGVVVNYVNDETMQVNGSALVALRVRYYDSNNAIKEVIVPTGGADPSKYRTGMGVRFRINETNKECLYISKVKSFPYAKELLNADLEISNNRSARKVVVSRTCPGCGATLMVSSTKDCVCKFCGRIVPYIPIDNTAQGEKV